MVCRGLFMLQGRLPNEYSSTLVNYSMFSFNIILFGFCKCRACHESIVGSYNIHVSTLLDGFVLCKSID